ncbi:MAG: WYL domain-containing protein, partial [Deltaproteobacteria bacterium]|nr:WYL domain-containing protein [Deltaproteobacteria bacterium]
PPERARQLRALCRRVFIGPPATPRIRESAGRAPAELLGVFERAFTAGLGLAFHYVDREGRPSARRVEPHGLLVEPPVWYVLAWDLERRAPRMFRMDRISRPRPLAGVPFRPDLAVVQAALPEAGRYRALSAS